MKKIFFPLASLLAVAMLFSSCKANVLRGEGKTGKANPSVSSFTAIEIELPVKTVINVQSGGTGIELSGYENVIKHIKTNVENNVLKVSSDLDETWDIDCEGVTLQVNLPLLVALSLSGAPYADIHGNVTGNEFKLDISGAGSVVIDNMNVTKFSSDVSGAANIEIKGGKVTSADYEISGAGKIKAFPLETATTTASISGAGKGEITATEKLDASISGAGTIKYKGHPAVTKNVSGVGTISEAN